MSTTSVVVEVKTRGQRQLEALHKSLLGTESAASKVQQAFGSKLTSAMQRAGAAGVAAGQKIKRGLDQAAAGVGRLTSKLGGLRGALVSIGAGAAVTGMIRGAASAEQLQLRLSQLSKEYGETARLQAFVSESAKTFGQSQVEAAQGVTDVYSRLRPLGISLEEIETIYKGFNATALAAGTSSEAAAGAFLQLSQALGSGTLQGDEFRSIAEQVPGILRLVSEEMGVSVGELKKLGSEGKITADIMINALAKGFELNKDKISEMLALSPAQKFKEFQNAAQELSNALGSELLPALIPIVKGATDLLKAFGELPGPVKTLTAAVVGLTAAFVVLAPAISATVTAAKALAAVTAPAWLLAAGPWVAAAAGVGALGKALYDTNETFRRFVDNIGGILADDLSDTFRDVSADATTSAKVIETVYRDVENKLRPLAERIKGYFKSAFKSTSTDAQASATTSKNAFSSFFSQLVSQGSAAFSQLGGIVGSWWNSLPEPIRKLFGGGAIADIAGAAGYLKGAAGRATAGPGYGQTSRFRNARDQAFERARQITGASPTPVPTFPGGSASSGGGGGRSSAGEDLAKKLEESLKAGRELSQEFTRQIQLRKAQSELEEKLLQIQFDYQDNEARINELMDEGQKASLRLLNTELQRLKTAEALNEEQKKYVDLMKDAWQEQGGGKSLNDSEFAADKNGLEQWISESEQNLKEFLSLENQIKTFATTFGDSFADAFGEVVKGTKSVQQAFADMLKKMGDALIDYAMTAIAQYTAIAIAKALAGMLSGGSSGMNKVADNLTKNPFGSNITGGAFAEGGFVTGPTNALIGEGGDSEYVIPSGKMDSAMKKWNQGVRGDAVVAGEGNASDRNGGGSGVNLSMSFQTTRFMDRDWVDREQLQQAMDKAAMQGGMMGQQRTLASLRNSPKTRRSVGV